jgi:hypothetical protein
MPRHLINTSFWLKILFSNRFYDLIFLLLLFPQLFGIIVQQWFLFSPFGTLCCLSYRRNATSAKETIQVYPAKSFLSPNTFNCSNQSWLRGSQEIHFNGQNLKSIILMTKQKAADWVAQKLKLLFFWSIMWSVDVVGKGQKETFGARFLYLLF